jgi:hypothetical protein
MHCDRHASTDCAWLFLYTSYNIQILQEDKWTFLKEGNDLGVPISPFLDIPAIVIKDKVKFNRVQQFSQCGVLTCCVCILFAEMYSFVMCVITYVFLQLLERGRWYGYILL